MVKKLLRGELKSLRDSIPEADRAACSAKLAELIRSMPEYTAAKRVLLYYPIGSEPDFLPLAVAAVADGKIIAFPAVDGKDMIFCDVKGIDGFHAGSMGIPEPDRSEHVDVSDFTDTLCVVPALAADRNGNRIGYGGGYYDRFLKRYTGFSVCAVYSRLLFDDLPAEAHDVSVDAVVSDGVGVLRFK